MPYKDLENRKLASRRHYENRTPEQIEQERLRHEHYYELQKARIAQVHAKYRDSHKKSRSEYQREYYRTHKDKVAAYRKRWFEKDPTYQQRHSWFRLYGVTNKQFDELIASQQNRCAICHQPETALARNSKRIKLLAVDHDHKTNAIRGLLCDTCNRGLGYFKDNPNLLIAAAEYLKSHTNYTG